MRSGEHLVRVLPVEDTCALDVGAIESMAKALADKHLSEEAKPTEARAMHEHGVMRGAHACAAAIRACACLCKHCAANRDAPACVECCQHEC